MTTSIMDHEKVKVLHEINKKILRCRKCDFHKELGKRSFLYKPEITLQSRRLKDNLMNLPDYKVMSIGINPGWPEQFNSKEWQDVYREDDYKGYIAKYFNALDSTDVSRNPYRDGLTRTFNRLNEKLNIYPDKDIKSVDIYEYLFWGNLSLCASNKPSKMKIGENNIIDRRVYAEEIPNCLDEGYLREVIKIIDPELILFFTIAATGYIYYKRILEKLLDVGYDDIIAEEKPVTAHQRNGKDVKTTFILCRIKNRRTKILFTPHPNYTINAELRDKALDDACDWFSDKSKDAAL